MKLHWVSYLHCTLIQALATAQCHSIFSSVVAFRILPTGDDYILSFPHRAPIGRLGPELFLFFEKVLYTLFMRGKSKSSGAWFQYILTAFNLDIQ